MMYGARLAEPAHRGFTSINEEQSTRLRVVSPSAIEAKPAHRDFTPTSEGHNGSSLPVFPNAVGAKTAQHGFTITELLLSLAVIFVISAFSFPVGMNFYKTEILHETTDGLTSALRRAYTQSIGQRNDSGYGIRIFEHHYVLFEGTEYGTRNVEEDEIFPMPSSVSITGLTEVVFEKMTGLPNEAGYIRISIGNDEDLINVNVLGVIEV